MNDKLNEAAYHTLVDCLAVRAGEKIVIITDVERERIGYALFNKAVELKTDPVMIMMMPRERSGQEPPPSIAAALKECDVFIIPTSLSLSHTDARRGACAAGARGATMPGVTEDMMARTMPVDYNVIARRSELVVEKMRGAKTLHITTELGTDIMLNLVGQKWDADTGIIKKPGDFGNLPAGEACAGVTYSGSSGIVVFDESFGDIGILEAPITIEFIDGVAGKISGDDKAAQLVKTVDDMGTKARLLAEIGIGTHHTAKITGEVLEDEKVMGTIHLAIGNDIGFGGSNDVPIHLDGIVNRPTLVTDTGEYIMRDGELLVDV